MYVVVNGIKKFAKVPRLLAENYCTDADRMHTGNKQTSIPIVCHNRLDLVDRHSKIVFYLCIISLVDVWQNIFSHSSVVFFIQILHFYDRSIVCDTHCWWGFSSITIHFIFSVKDQNNWKKNVLFLLWTESRSGIESEWERFCSKHTHNIDEFLKK